jgi:hypothetical protein
MKQGFVVEAGQEPLPDEEKRAEKIPLFIQRNISLFLAPGKLSERSATNNIH